MVLLLVGAVAVVLLGVAFYLKRLRVLPAFLACLWWATPTTGLMLPVPYVSLSDLIITGSLAVIIVLVPKRLLSWLGGSVFLYLVPLTIGLAFLGAIGLVFWSTDPRGGSEYYRHTSLSPILILLVFVVSLRTPRDIRATLRLFVWSSGLFAGLLLLNQAWRTFDPETLRNTMDGMRLGGQPTWPAKFRAQYDPVSLGVALSNLFPIAVAYFATVSRPGARSIVDRFAVVPLIVVAVAIFQTGTRSAWIAALIAACFVLVLIRRRPPLALVPIAIVLVVLYGKAGTQVTSVSGERVRSLASLRTDENLLGRIEYFQQGVASMARFPFGIGYGREGRELINEHNLFVFVGLGSGMLGLVLFVGFIGVITVTLVKAWRLAPANSRIKVLCAGGIGTLASVLLNGTSDTVLMETFQVNAVFVGLGLALAAAGPCLRLRKTRITKQTSRKADPLEQPTDG